MTFDKNLIQAYVALHEPADRIACFQTIRASFLRLLPNHIREDKEDDQLIWRLLQLRKSGQLPTARKER